MFIFFFFILTIRPYLNNYPNYFPWSSLLRTNVSIGYFRLGIWALGVTSWDNLLSLSLFSLLLWGGSPVNICSMKWIMLWEICACGIKSQGCRWLVMLETIEDPWGTRSLVFGTILWDSEMSDELVVEGGDLWILNYLDLPMEIFVLRILKCRVLLKQRCTFLDLKVFCLCFFYHLVFLSRLLGILLWGEKWLNLNNCPKLSRVFSYYYLELCF